jgi:hypothetical protein
VAKVLRRNNGLPLPGMSHTSKQPTSTRIKLTWCMESTSRRHSRSSSCQSLQIRRRKQRRRGGAKALEAAVKKAEKAPKGGAEGGG